MYLLNALYVVGVALSQEVFTQRLVTHGRAITHQSNVDSAVGEELSGLRMQQHRIFPTVQHHGYPGLH